MERYTSTDKSRLLNFKVRIGETSVPKVLTFVRQDGTPYDISGKGFEIPVKKSPSAKQNVFKLTEGSGLTVQGGGLNQLLVEVSASQATMPRPDVYFATLFSVEEDHTWLNGDWEFHNGKYDGVTETDTITIYEDGGSVLITITGDGVTGGGEQLNIDGGNAFTDFTEVPIIDGGGA